MNDHNWSMRKFNNDWHQNRRTTVLQIAINPNMERVYCKKERGVSMLKGKFPKYVNW